MSSRIARIRVFAQRLSAANRYTMSSSAVADPEATIVEITDEAGRVGWGEVCLASAVYQPEHNAGVQAGVAALAPALLGADASSIGSCRRLLDAAMLGQPGAKAAIEIALWDLAGHRLGVPMHELVGGAHDAETVGTYHVIGIGSPDEAAADAVRLQSEGHNRLQLKAGGRPIADDVAAAHAVADVLEPTTELAVDVNRGWTTAEAIQFSNGCANVRMSIEQPCDSAADLRSIRDRLRHPLIIDESSTDLAVSAGLIADGTASAFGIKLSRVGGLSPVMGLRELCASARVPMSTDDAWGGDIMAAACAHLGATVDPRLHRGTWLAHPYHQTHYDELNGPRIVDGRVTIPAGGPGLGLLIDATQFGAPTHTFD